MASDRQQEGHSGADDSEPEVGIPADELLSDQGGGEPDPNGPLGQLPDVTEARLAEAGAIPPAVGGTPARLPVEEHEVEHHGPRKGLFGRAGDFLRASWAELKRVQWPDRRQVAQGTAVVLGFVIVAGIYLGGLDALWNPIIQAIL